MCREQGFKLRRKNASAVLAVCVVIMICSFHINFESMVTSKYLAFCTAFIATSLIWHVKLRGDFLFVAARNSHFDFAGQTTPVQNTLFVCIIT